MTGRVGHVLHLGEIIGHRALLSFARDLRRRCRLAVALAASGEIFRLR